MKDSKMQKRIQNLYGKFFRKSGINEKNGTFPKNSRWSFLRFPTYPLIGSGYAKKKNCRVLFIGLEIGKDPGGEITGFDEKRIPFEDNKKKHNPHGYGMGVAIVFLLKNVFKINRERTKILKGKTYKEACKLAEKFKPDFNLFSYVAMTNCHKFVTIGSKRRSHAKDGKHISTDAEWDLLEEEIRILKPKFLVFESKKFTTDHWFQPLISEIKKQNKNTEIYISNHPSDRGLHSNTSKYLETFKKI